MEASAPLEEAAERPQNWTEELRQTILRESERNLFFFARVVCGYKDITDTHRELCENLDGRGDWGAWRRGLICCHRGWIKTSIVRAWALREALFRVNWTCRYLGSSYDNAKLHFLDPIKNLFMQSAQAQLVRWLFEHRIPVGFLGWTDTYIVFLRTDANAPPAISIKGIGADQEGYHGNAIIIDDPEGAESEKSNVQQIDAIRSVANATPLLIKPGEDRILLIGTVHGADPVVYRALYENFNPEEPPPTGEVNWDNSKRVWKQFWRPVYLNGKIVFPYDADGTPRFTEEILEVIRRGNADMWKKQYLLLRSGQGTGSWSRKIIEKNRAKWKDPGTKRIVQYPALKIDAVKWREQGKLDMKEVWRECPLHEMFFYLQFDPKHKQFTTSYQRAKVRPAQAAIVVVGVSPDGHAFVVERWCDANASLEKQLETLIHLHIKWGARKLIIDPIGAQAWLKSILDMNERSNPVFQSLRGKSLWGETRYLPRLSAILEEDKRSPKMSKEEHIYHRLDPLIAEGRLHTFEEHSDLENQLIGFPDETEYIDLADALAQGVEWWQGPLGSEEQQRARKEQQLLQQIGQRYTNYRSPLKRKPSVLSRQKPDFRPDRGGLAGHMS